MQRREFSRAVAATAALNLAQAFGTDDRAGRPAQGKESKKSGPVERPPAMGLNLSGMEWARPGLRHSLSSWPNVHFSVPRAGDVAYLTANGYTRNRLPIQWELLQPMLLGSVASASVRALVGQPGEFHAAYAACITSVLDAHAAAGMGCIIDLHNYGRYQDFRYQADGSVIGLRAAPQPMLRPYTTDPGQVQERIFALAPGATLTPAHFADVWRRAALHWKNHPGLAGYGLMNEPHDLPQAGQVVASTSREDLLIWPAFAQAAIAAIRAVDTARPIYLAGNAWSSAMSIGTHNPAWPLAGTGLIYEVHLYLDARSTGQAFDYDTELLKSRQGGSRPIDADTGRQRLKIATDWAQAHGVKLALTEVGMPIDDTRWEEMFSRVARHAQQTGCELYGWLGGNHWPIRSHPLNQLPCWYQSRTLEPTASALLKAAAGLHQATLFDEGPSLGAADSPMTITVLARGHLAAPLTFMVAAEGGGSLNPTQLTIPAGANGRASYTFTPAGNSVATLRYSASGAQVPPARKVYTLSDPVAHATSRLSEAAMAILARYAGCQWLMADGYTDFMLGRPAADGQTVRAIADSGFGSSLGNAMEMLTWVNDQGPASGGMRLAVMRSARGKPYSDHTAPNTCGFWCKKSLPLPGLQPQPRNRVPYHLEGEHFAIAVVGVPGGQHSGVIFQASSAEHAYYAELSLMNNQPAARFRDARGQTLQLISPEKLRPQQPVVLSLTCAPGAQRLRINARHVAGGSVVFAPSAFSQFLIAGGFLDYSPRNGFAGHVYAVITGQGAPTMSELAVLERHLASQAGLSV
jgi:endoglucanase